jgi:hypothetical protein
LPLTIEEWAAVCKRVKIVEEQYLSREHEKDSAMERIITPTTTMMMMTRQILRSVATILMIYKELVHCPVTASNTGMLESNYKWGEVKAIEVWQQYSEGAVK